MLSELLRAVDRTRRVRRVRRTTVPLMMLMVVTGAVAVMVRPWGAGKSPAPAAPPDARWQHVEVVLTGEGVLKGRVLGSSEVRRFIEVVATRPVEELGGVEVVDDRRLLHSLAEAGLARGEVRVGGRLLVIGLDESLSDRSGESW